MPLVPGIPRKSGVVVVLSITKLESTDDAAAAGCPHYAGLCSRRSFGRVSPLRLVSEARAPRMNVCSRQPATFAGGVSRYSRPASIVVFLMVRRRVERHCSTTTVAFPGPSDGFHAVAQSSLLNTPQLSSSSMYSTTGTRCHLVLCFKPLLKKGTLELDTKAIFFAQATHAADDDAGRSP